MKIRFEFILYLYYEFIAMYLDEINKKNIDCNNEYDEKAVDIWYKLTKEEMGLLNLRGRVISINDLIESNNKILNEELAYAKNNTERT